METSLRFRPVIHLLLALALIAPLIAWTPAQAAQEPVAVGQVNAETAVALRARVVSHTVQIAGAGFSRRHTFQVGVSRRRPMYWVLLGTVQPGRSGRIYVTYNLPSSMWNARVVYVCLRDTTTSKVTCVPAYRW